MQNSRKTSDTKIKKEKEDSKKDDKLKKNVFSVSTPREYVSKTSAKDIYAQKKSVTKAPKKVPGISTTSSVSPMKGLLKSSASFSSQNSKTDKTPKKLEAKHSTRDSNTTPKTRKKEITNVTVNSPVVKRKLNSERNKDDLNKTISKEVGNESRSEAKAKEVGNKSRPKEAGKSEKQIKENGERERTKTRTLDDSEVKILTPDNVDNNVEMRNLSKKLVAKPKAFYVELDEEKPKSLPKKESSDEEISYEDDFESYESDFDSYHSDASEANSERSGSEASRHESEASKSAESEREASTESSTKERDEERMLDSGNFDLRDQRSAKATVMAFILEDTECDKSIEDKKSTEDSKKSLDEGFQDMGSSASSIRTVDILDRPLFIDFTKSKANKAKIAFNERLKQRAKDLLSMITLHEMKYYLYEMQPIAYDLYIATFGRNNYTQSGIQTFDDGVTEEVQTDEVSVSQKWTQYPVEFSKSDICGNKDVLPRKYSRHTEDYLTKFTFLVNEKYDGQNNDRIISDENYKVNPLRIFFEQKNGVGSDEMLPYETYKSKLKSNEYNPKRLSRFLKKVESKISSILSKNNGGKDLKGLEKSGKLPFSKGHVTISPKYIENPKFSFLRTSKINKVFFSETKSNLLMSVHKKVKGIDEKKCLVCLWDLNVARDPIKILLAIDDIAVGRFRGNTDGIFVAALDDGSIHLWDLTEEPAWRDSVASDTKSPEIVGVEERLTQTETDREWNLKNCQVGLQQMKTVEIFSSHLAIVYSSAGPKICYKSQKECQKLQSSVKDWHVDEHNPCIEIALQSCAYTNSAYNMDGADTDYNIGLELMTNQIVSLQRTGILTIWSVIQEKKTSKDIGKAFWSKIRLEKHQSINLMEHIDTTLKENANFNLYSAKRRITQRKFERNLLVKENSRPKTASNFDFDIDRPYSAASLRKKVLPVEINLPKSWESGIVCNDLKIVNVNSVYSFLVAKNCGEVVCCKRCLGVVKVERFSVATDTSSITNLEVSEGLPYFLAASDSGTVSLCSILDMRVLLTLDCRNVPAPLVDKCQSDVKGRFVSSVAKSTSYNDGLLTKLPIKSVHWSSNRCCIYILLGNGTLQQFDITHSDIMASSVCDGVAIYSAVADNSLALISEDNVRIHRLTNEVDVNSLHLFNKYVELL